MGNAALDIIKEIVFHNRDRHGIPPMDGPFHPNDLLDEVDVFSDTMKDIDDIAINEKGDIYVSSGNTIVRLNGSSGQRETVFAQFDTKVGGINFHPDGRLMACVSRKGLVIIGNDGKQTWITTADGQTILCPTTAVADRNGKIYIADGSTYHDPQNWVRDLMEKRKAGRLIIYEPHTGKSHVLLSELSYPYGLAITNDGQDLLITESWSHTLSSYKLNDIRKQSRKLLIPNLPGYPARIVPSLVGGYWMCLFALRTGLIELVLSENTYRKKMMETIENTAHWVAPALSSGDDILEYSQAGRMKVFGILKPYAPSRSYGLVVELDEECEPIRSLQSRVGGRRHGITGISQHGNNLYIVSKGNNKILKLNTGKEVG
jgi:hypothetical protein